MPTFYMTGVQYQMFSSPLYGTGSRNGLSFMHKLEQRIFEKHRDIPKPYSEVTSALKEKFLTSGQSLAHQDVQSLVNFSGYLTALPWESRARYLAMTSDILSSMDQIHRLVKKA